ncbi:hypothetical protein BaRGS_00022156 [Batillaria attramentaria]|uniref:Uncharacterized protein n=1 Tax=Batillaria attramentaria TaxID=370345 RepID=A0ABD0KHS5_9CAEN
MHTQPPENNFHPRTNVHDITQKLYISLQLSCSDSPRHIQFDSTKYPFERPIPQPRKDHAYGWPGSPSKMPISGTSETTVALDSWHGTRPTWLPGIMKSSPDTQQKFRLTDTHFSDHSSQSAQLRRATRQDQ